MRASRAWLACLLLLPTLACRAGGQPPEDSPAADRQERSAAPGAKDETLREEALALLDERERALADGDREAFLATVDPDELGFSATQARWFDNLAQLPMADVSMQPAVGGHGCALGYSLRCHLPAFAFVCCDPFRPGTKFAGCRRGSP